MPILVKHSSSISRIIPPTQHCQETVFLSFWDKSFDLALSISIFQCSQVRDFHRDFKKTRCCAPLRVWILLPGFTLYSSFLFWSWSFSNPLVFFIHTYRHWSIIVLLHSTRITTILLLYYNRFSCTTLLCAFNSSLFELHSDTLSPVSFKQQSSGLCVLLTTLSLSAIPPDLRFTCN